MKKSSSYPSVFYTVCTFIYLFAIFVFIYLLFFSHSQVTSTIIFNNIFKYFVCIYSSHLWGWAVTSLQDKDSKRQNLKKLHLWKYVIFPKVRFDFLKYIQIFFLSQFPSSALLSNTTAVLCWLTLWSLWIKSHRNAINKNRKRKQKYMFVGVFDGLNTASHQNNRLQVKREAQLSSASTAGSTLHAAHLYGNRAQSVAGAAYESRRLAFVHARCF